MIAADSLGFAYMNSTALRRALDHAADEVALGLRRLAGGHAETFDSGGITSGAATMSLYLPPLFDHSGSVTGTTSTPPISSCVEPGAETPGADQRHVALLQLPALQQQERRAPGWSSAGW